MAGLAEMLQQGGAPEPDMDEGGGLMPQQGEDMPIQQAIQVMQKFGIQPDDLPMVAQAVIAIIKAQQEQGRAAPPAGPPGMGGPPRGGAPMPPRQGA